MQHTSCTLSLVLFRSSMHDAHRPWPGSARERHLKIMIQAQIQLKPIRSQQRTLSLEPARCQFVTLRGATCWNYLISPALLCTLPKVLVLVSWQLHSDDKTFWGCATSLHLIFFFFCEGIVPARKSPQNHKLSFLYFCWNEIQSINCWALKRVRCHFLFSLWTARG